MESLFSFPVCFWGQGKTAAGTSVWVRVPYFLCYYMLLMASRLDYLLCFSVPNFQPQPAFMHDLNEP